jgi:hypothetical protein
MSENHCERIGEITAQQERISAVACCVVHSVNKEIMRMQ